MKFVTIILFLISVLLFFGSILNFLTFKRPGFYPPKQLVKKRSVVLAGSGGIILLFAILLSSF